MEGRQYRKQIQECKKSFLQYEQNKEISTLQQTNTDDIRAAF